MRLALYYETDIKKKGLIEGTYMVRKLKMGRSYITLSHNGVVITKVIEK